MSPGAPGGAGAATRIGRRGATWVLVAVSLAQLATVIDYYALTVALPTIADDFGVTTPDLHWVITAYLLAFAALLVVGGRLADMVGRRRMAIAGAAAFGVASGLCALAPGPELLVAFRVLQGASAALVVPASMAALAAAFPTARRAAAIGVVMGVTSAGNALGPFIGGALTGSVGWRAVFLINVPVCLAGALACRAALDESHGAPGQRLDLPGALTLAGGLVALTLTIDRVSEWPPWSAVAGAGVTVALFAGFLHVERRAPFPLVDLALLRRKGVRTVVIAGCVDNFGWAVAIFGVTIYLQQVRGLSPLQSGTVFLAMSAGTAVGGPAAGLLVRRLGFRRVMALGIALSASGLLALAVVRGLGPFLVALAVTGVGVGLTYSVAVIATAHGVPESDTGQAEGITLTAMVIVAALAVTVGGMVIEAASGGGAPDQAGIDAALLLGAGVAAAALLVLLGGFLASRPPHQVHRATPRVFPIRRGP